MRCPVCDDEMERCDFCKKDTYCLNCGCQSETCMNIKMNRTANKKSETITFRLPKRLLKQVDSYMKHYKISNRTQAIEELLKGGLSNVNY
jgi:hypothetical protein